MNLHLLHGRPSPVHAPHIVRQNILLATYAIQFEDTDLTRAPLTRAFLLRWSQAECRAEFAAIDDRDSQGQLLHGCSAPCLNTANRQPPPSVHAQSTVTTPPAVHDPHASCGSSHACMRTTGSPSWLVPN